MRRTLTTIALALLTVPAAVLSTACRSRTAEGPRNLVLVTIDTLRQDRVGAYGAASGAAYGAASPTPVLDRLAREGVRFADAASAAPLTLPSHATILSGLLPPHHGLHDNGAGRFPAGRATLATLLAGAGYRTGAFVGAFVLDHRFGLDRGFEVYDDEVDRSPEGTAHLESERRGDRVMDRALAWLQREDPRPFFLWVHLYDPHFPYDPPEPWRGQHPGQPYDGEVGFADAQVGRLLAALDGSGAGPRTVLAVAADHGEALGDHGEPTHGLFLYEPTLRVPLLVRATGLLQPRVIATPVSLADLAPTLAGLVGQDLSRASTGAGADRRAGAIAPIAPIDGRDLAPDLLAGREPAAADLYAETQYPRLFGWSALTALTRRGVKYIAAPRPELYDLARDPQESVNLLTSVSQSGSGQSGSGQPGSEDASRRAKGFADRLAALATTGPSGSTGPTGSGAPDAETRARLASLGYAAPSGLGSPAGDRTGKEAADPKDRVELFRRYEAARRALASGRAESAVGALPELAAVVAADPGNPIFRGELAKARRMGGDLAAAVPLYRQVVAATPGDADAWYNLAVALQESGQLAEARSAVAETLRLDPRRSGAHNVLGVLASAAGDAAAARAAFSQATALDPRNAQAWNNLGNALRSLGRAGEAEAAYHRATEAAPGYAEPWNGLGTLAVERNQPRAALADFDRALAIAPGYLEVRMNRAIACELAGDRAAALDGYRDFLAAADDDPAFVEQRRAARQLLSRLSDREAGSATQERR